MVPLDRKTDGQLIDDATRWLVGLDAGTADEAAFLAWRDADPRRSVAFAEAASAWRALDRLQWLEGAGGTPPPPAGREPAPSQPDLRRRRMLGGLAASVAVGLVGGGAVLALKAASRRINTQVGERRTLQLPDGSVAELNTDSRIRWSFGEFRTVWLDQGEIALMVVQDAARPFLVHAGSVVGSLERGRYNVRLKESGPQFISLAGAGTIRGGADAMARLEPLRAVAAASDGPRAAQMAAFEVQDAVAWQNGEIIFRGMTLAAAATEFNRYLERKIVVDPSAASIRLGGRFRVNDLPAFLSSLQGSFGIHVTSSEQNYFLSAD